MKRFARGLGSGALWERIIGDCSHRQGGFLEGEIGEMNNICVGRNTEKRMGTYVYCSK